MMINKAALFKDISSFLKILRINRPHHSGNGLQNFSPRYDALAAYLPIIQYYFVAKCQHVKPKKPVKGIEMKKSRK